MVRDIVAIANGEAARSISVSVRQTGARPRPAERRGNPGRAGDGGPGSGRAGDFARDSSQLTFENKIILVVRVPPGTERPYALAAGDILVRRGDQTEPGPARRDRSDGAGRSNLDNPAADRAPEAEAPKSERQEQRERRPQQKTRQRQTTAADKQPDSGGRRLAPRNGVEIVEVVG